MLHEEPIEYQVESIGGVEAGFHLEHFRQGQIIGGYKLALLFVNNSTEVKAVSWHSPKPVDTFYRQQGTLWGEVLCNLCATASATLCSLRSCIFSGVSWLRMDLLTVCTPSR